MNKLNSLSLKISVPKNKRKNNSEGIKIVEKNKEGKVFIDENNDYKISISMNNDPDCPDLLILPFTEKSYNIVGRTTVFTRNVDEHGKRIRYIRSDTKAKYDYGDPERYIPFAPNWIVKGNIVRDNNILKFDFIDLITKDGYSNIICNYE